MSFHVEWSRQSALVRRIEAVQAAGRPGSRAMNAAQKDIRQICIDDHISKMERGVTKDNAPRAPLAPSTLADPKRGSGPSLIPRGRASRFISLFEAIWQPGGGSNPTALTLIMRYRDFRTKDGKYSIPELHEKGASRPGTRWVLPPRPTQGLTPDAWPKIDARLRQLAEEVLRGH